MRRLLTVHGMLLRLLLRTKQVAQRDLGPLADDATVQQVRQQAWQVPLLRTDVMVYTTSEWKETGEELLLKCYREENDESKC